MPNPNLLEGRRALVTGAGAGIGRAIARALAGAGARVAVTDKVKAAAATVAAEIGRAAVSASLDVTNARETEHVFDEMTAELGGLDIVCANAGISTMNWAVDLSEAEFPPNEYAWN